MRVLPGKVKPAYFLLFFLLIAFKPQAAPLDSTTAKAAAFGFYSQHVSAGNIALTLAYTEKDANGTPDFYIFNVNSNSGFVMVTADDAGYPIMGYSNTGHYTAGPLNENLAYWFDHYKKQVDNIRAQHLQATTGIQNEWITYKNNRPIQQTARVLGNVNPLLSTIWGQDTFYNALCPGDCPVGCVATAMAQIMKYWQFPPHGMGSVNDSIAPYGTLYANLDTSHYNWPDMPNNVVHANPSVALLMYDLGVSLTMAYTPTSSGSYMIASDAQTANGISAQSVFVSNYGYNGGTIQGLYKSDYDSIQWATMLENELNNHRPVQYAGEGDIGAHSWVCDGYDNTGYFHMNFGFNSGGDGYYNLNDINPNVGGIIPLSEDEEALIGIEPNNAVSDFYADRTIVRAGDTVNYTDNSFGTGPVTNLQWQFAGATAVDASNSQKPSAMYGTPGTYATTETVTTTKGNTTNIRYNYITVLDNNTVNVYPTANNGTFSIQLHDGTLSNSGIQFHLYNDMGQKVYSTTLTQYITQENMQLPHGIYIYRTLDNTGHVVGWGKMAVGD